MLNITSITCGVLSVFRNDEHCRCSIPSEILTPYGIIVEFPLRAYTMDAITIAQTFYWCNCRPITMPPVALMFLRKLCSCYLDSTFGIFLIYRPLKVCTTLKEPSGKDQGLGQDESPCKWPKLMNTNCISTLNYLRLQSTSNIRIAL